MKGFEDQVVHVEEIQGDNNNNNNQAMFGNETQDQQRENVMWLDDDDQREQEADLVFYDQDFPSLPDNYNFPCMSSSSSSSSSIHAPLSNNRMITSSSTSSSAASWVDFKSDADHQHQQQHYTNNPDDGNNNLVQLDVPTGTLSSTASMEILQENFSNGLVDDNHQQAHYMNVMDDFEYMDLLDTSDFLDPSSMFQSDIDNDHNNSNIFNNIVVDPDFQLPDQPLPTMEGHPLLDQTGNEETNQGVAVGGGGSHQLPSSSEDLAMVFFDWLKNNKESVSAEDLRRVKIKKATIESAAKRLGGGKEAMKQLLKLILEWVQTNHLQRRNNNNNNSLQQQQNPMNPNPDPSSACFNTQSQWIHSATYVHSFNPQMVGGGGFINDPFINGGPVASNLYQAPQMLDSTQSSWFQPQFGFGSQYSSTYPEPLSSGYVDQCSYHQYPSSQGDNRTSVRLSSSATKEARRKRMARQRRFLSHHRSQNQSQIQQNSQNQSVEQHAMLDGVQSNEAIVNGGNNNWVYWHAPSAMAAPFVPVDVQPVQVVDQPIAMQVQNYQRQVAADRRQGWKPEKNLRFLLQKVLKQSDVGNLGRIVLPKKEAETHLPELEARDGISIAMEDIGTSRVWNMRYRFWPNNKSRMYLLENTGDFVKANELQEGDFIVIYSDMKCGKYLIRGVKVRQPGLIKLENKKAENKKSSKSQRNMHAKSLANNLNNNGSSSSTPPIITASAKPQTVN